MSFHRIAGFGVEDDTAQTGVAGIFNTRPELNFTTTVDNKIKNYLAKVSYQITPSHNLAGRYLRENSPQFNQIINNGNAVATRAAAREEADTDSNWIATLDSVFGSAALNEVRVSFTKEDVAFANPAFNNNGQSSQAQRNQAPVELRPTVLDGASGVAQARVNESTQLDDTFSYFLPAWHGEHQLKTGSASLGAEHEIVPGLSVALDLVHNENKDTLLAAGRTSASSTAGR